MEKVYKPNDFQLGIGNHSILKEFSEHFLYARSHVGRTREIQKF
jgi:hypothetical protein